MKVVFNILLSVAVLCCRVAVAADEGFERYQEILDRKPFGETLPDPAAITNAPPVTAGDALFVKTMKMVAIRINRNGSVRVGFVNQAAGNKGYYLNVGETSPDGIELVEADFVLEMALLKKESQSGWIYMNGSPKKPESEFGKGKPSALAFRISSPEIDKAVEQRREMLYADVLKKRKALQESKKRDYAEIFSAKTATNTRIDAAQLEKQVKDYQMDAIRTGLTPLPIPLTKEMDDQLVKEGVLPAVQ